MLNTNYQNPMRILNVQKSQKERKIILFVWNVEDKRLFLAMSLMSLQLWTLADLAGSILLLLIAQVIVITGFTIFVVFRFMGRDYDAAVISGGYAGLGLGATPTAIANMEAITQKFGASPMAFLVIPLVGAFFIDISNALIIGFFLDLIN